MGFSQRGNLVLTCRGQDFSFSERLAPKADRSTSQKIHLTQCECGTLVCFCVRPECDCFAIGTSILKILHLVDQGPRVLIKRVQVQDERGCPDARKGLADPRDGNLRRRPPRHLALALALSLALSLSVPRGQKTQSINPSICDPSAFRERRSNPVFWPQLAASDGAGGVRARTQSSCWRHPLGEALCYASRCERSA